MIAAVMNVANEMDIVGICLRHHIANGIDRVYIYDASTDGTRDIYTDLISEGVDLRVHDDTGQYWEQAALTNALVDMARADGAAWIVPVDADEFIYSPDGRTIAEALADCPHDVLYMQRWLHTDWDHRHIDSERLPKVLFRGIEGAHVDFGNHQCSLLGGTYGVLEMRELQFRSFEHFCTKNRRRIASLSPQSRAAGYGTHQTHLEGYSDEQMRAEWEAMMALLATFDPIPLRVPQ